MLIKKLTSHGNSLALIIDKPILQLLNADEDTSFLLKIQGSSLLITPLEGAAREEALRHFLEQADREYGKAFKMMAEMPEESHLKSTAS